MLFCLAGGPVSERGFCLGRGLARFNKVRLGGPKVRRIRARCSDPGDGALVDLHRDHSVRRRLRAVLDVIAAIGRSGFTVSRGLELTRQWGSIVAGGPQGNVTAEALARVAGLGLADMEASVVDLHQGVDSFLQNVVRSRKDKALLGWKAWILEDPSSHPYRWLRPDLVPPSPFLQCDPEETVGGSGVIAVNFGRLGCPIFLGLLGVLLIWMNSLRRLLEAGYLCWMFFTFLLLLAMCWLKLFGRRSLLLVVWMVGVGRNLRPFHPLV